MAGAGEGVGYLDETKEVGLAIGWTEGLTDLPWAPGAEGKLCQPHTDS